MGCPEGARPDRTAFGIVIILVSVLIMAFADAVVKLVSADLTLWQILVARALVAMPIAVAAARATGIRLKPRAPAWVYLRSGLLMLTWLAFYASLPKLSLSVAAVAIYTNPIMTALLAAALLGEPVGRRQWGGVLLGFTGVFVILKPGGDAFSWFTLLPLLGAAFYALAMVLTRSKCRDEAPLSLVLNLHAAFLATGLTAMIALAVIGLPAETQMDFPFLLGGWTPMGLWEWSLMALIGALSVGFFMGAARAYQIAPPPIVATFDYGYVVAATLWGFVFFAETPDAATIGGMVLVTAAGLLVSAPASRRTSADAAAR